MNSGEEARDAELLARVRADDKSAFGELFERHHEAALRAAKRFTAGTRISAEDCVSDAFAQIFAALQRGKGPDEFFRAYLYTVMRNAVQAANRVDSESVTVDDFEIIERTSKKHDVDPAITRFETEVVRAAFASLPERWQSVLWYSDIEEMKPAEVAPILGLTSHGVSMLRTRAREGLRSAYLQEHLRAVAPGSACEGVASKLGAFSRMTLSARERAKVTAHLADCADCTAMAAEVKNVNRGLLGIIALLFFGTSAQDLFGVFGRGAGATAATVSSGASASRIGPAVRSTATVAATVMALFASTPRAGASPSTTRGGAMALSSTSRPRRVATIAGVAGIAAVVLLILMIIVPNAQAPVGSSEMLAPVPRGEQGDVVETGEMDLPPGTGPADFSADPAPLIPGMLPPKIPQAEPPAPPAAPPAVAPPVIAPVVPVNLLANGGFDGPGYDANNGEFAAGENLDGWVVGPPSGGNPALKTVKVWFAEMTGAGPTYAAPFTYGPWARVMGSISQTVPTEVGKTYVLEYLSRASGSDANPFASGWNGGNKSFAAVNGQTVDTFDAVLDPLYTPRSVTFVATTTSTVVSFGNVGGGAVGFDSISLKIVP